ncbi:MAG TPA: helix-turn-helix transcriptional regulator, partial [Legionellaceae bacterium]|nr:helix-turn-helix transcriptional regulator [Legionellaceae bacterium]
YQNNFHLLGGDVTVDNLHSGVTLTSNMINVNNDKLIFESCKQFFDIGDGILLIDRFEDYREVYWFTSDTSNKYLLNYSHTVELLKIFINSFKEKASKIIKNAEYQRILRPPTKLALEWSANHIHNPDEIDFLKEMSTKKYRFCYKKREIILSRKELQCALGVLCGKSAKEIATDLCRSVRTVEGHIENIKFKIGSSSRSSLVSILLDMGVNVYLNRIF